MNDLRFALRQLFKEKRFTIVAILALAIGIGANTAIFSVVNAVLLKPLPFPHPDQLVAWGSIINRPGEDNALKAVSYPDFFDYRAQNKSFASLAVYHDENLALAGNGPAESLRAQQVSGDFLDVLGVRPYLGRAFQRNDENAGGGPNGLSVILSYDFWQSHFKGDRAIIGKSLQLNHRPFTVIGVMPQNFAFPIDQSPAEIFVTIALDAFSVDGNKPPTSERGMHSVRGIGRLKPGVSTAQAHAELQTLSAALARQYPDSNMKFRAGAAPWRQELVGDVARGLYVLFGAVGCVLLIASANVANLLLARATVRQKEIALRSALGASRGRIIRQLLTESVLLAGLGGLCGLLLAFWGTDWLVSFVPESIPRAQHIQLDGTVLAFTLLASLGTGILFGLVPALQTARVDLRGTLNDSARGTSGAGHRRLRSALVVAEVALALLLLTGAGLLLQSFDRLSRVDSGVQPEHLFTASIALPEAAYPKPGQISLFVEQLLTRLRALPGVINASTVFPLPLSGSNITTSFDRQDHPKPEGERDTSPLRIAGADYFRTMGVSLVRGRLFDASDRFDSKPVILINEKFAQQYFPNENPIGKQMRPGISLTDGDGPMREIVGIVRNVKHQSLRLAYTPEMYVPASQMPLGFFAVIIRTDVTQPSTLTASVRDAVSKIDPGVPLTRVKMFENYLSDSLARPRFNALLLSLFAGVALLLTAIGIYGVMAYSVAQRRQEIGIRMALGAQKRDVLRLIVGGGMKLTALGVLIGIGAAFALTRLLGNLLYGVPAFDGLTFAAVALLLGAIAFFACWLPARRAVGVNPVIALRAE